MLTGECGSIFHVIIEYGFLAICHTLYILHSSKISFFHASYSITTVSRTKFFLSIILSLFAA
jgi:hypothetical protein